MVYVSRLLLPSADVMLVIVWTKMGSFLIPGDKNLLLVSLKVVSV